jgi:hypothetical protein
MQFSTSLPTGTEAEQQEIQELVAKMLNVKKST